MDTLCCSIKHPYSEVLFYQEIFIQGWPEPQNRTPARWVVLLLPHLPALFPAVT